MTLTWRGFRNTDVIDEHLGILLQTWHKTGEDIHTVLVAPVVADPTEQVYVGTLVEFGP